MATFTKRRDFVFETSKHSALDLGSTFTFTIPRKGYIAEMYLQVFTHVGTAAATLGSDGLAGIVKKMTLNVPSENSRNVLSNISGRGLLEYNSQLDNLAAGKTLQALALDSLVTDPSGGATVDTQGRAAITSILTALRGAGLVGASGGTGTFRQSFKINCCHPQMDSPIKELFALPASKWDQDATLEVVLGSQADLDTNGSATFALGANKVWAKLVIVYFIPPERYDTIPWEMTETEFSVGSNTGVTKVLELPTQGQLTGLLIRSWSATNTRGSITNDIGTKTSGNLELKFNDTTYSRFDDDILKDINDPTSGLGFLNRFAGVQFLDFLTDGENQAKDLGSLLDLNVDSSVKPALYQDIESGLTGAKNRYIWHKLIGAAPDLLKLTASV